MQFRLSTLLWFFVVIACALGTFGVWGLLITAFLLIQMPLAQKRSRVGILITWGLVGLFFSLAVHSHWEAARWSACANNLKMIGIALHNYHDKYGQFPPAYVADAHGRPMHSWRVLLLPYMEEGEDFVKQYRFDEPWDGPNNRKLATKAPHFCFQCPETGNHQAVSSQATSYVAVTGPGTAWPGDKGTRVSDFRDGTCNTILIVEIAGSDIHWMEPRDITLDEALAGPNGECRVPSSHHSTGRCYFWGRSYPLAGNVLLADGSVERVWVRPSRDGMAPLLSIAGGESVDNDVAFRRTAYHGWLDWGRCIGYPLFFLSLIVLVSHSSTKDSPASQPVKEADRGPSEQVQDADHKHQVDSPGSARGGQVGSTP